MLPRRLLRLFAALLAVLVAGELAARLLDPGLPEPVTWYHEIAQAKTEQMDDHEGALDLVFTGTSQSYHAIDPEVVDERLGTRSYNAGIPAGIPTLQRRWLLETVLAHLDEVDTVVWAMSSVDMNDARPQNITSVYDSAVATRPGTLADLDRWLSGRLAVFRHRRTLADPREWFDSDDPLDVARSVLLSSGKRTPGSTNLTDRERQRVRDDVIGRYRVGGRMSDAVSQTVADLRAQGIDVVFAWLPEAPRFVDLLPDPSVRDQAKEEAVRLADELGVGFVDVSAGFGDDDFIDYTHVDGGAAERISTRLAAKLDRTH